MTPRSATSSIIRGPAAVCASSPHSRNVALGDYMTEVYTEALGGAGINFGDRQVVWLHPRPTTSMVAATIPAAPRLTITATSQT